MTSHHLMLPEVLPSGADGEECYGDLDPVGARPDELAAVRTAAAARRAEFHTVRALARRALERLAPEEHHRHSAHSLLPGARGAPIWPSGVVGSMTHSPGYRAAVVARSSTYAALGVDAEPNRSLPAEVCELVCRPEERSMIEALSRRDPTTAWSRVVFSAKESIYKAWYPLVGTWLDYPDIAVRIDRERRTFRARLTGHLGPASAHPGHSRTMKSLRGAWFAADTLIVTTAHLQPIGR